MTHQDSTDEQLLWKSWTESKDPQAGDLLMRKYITLVNYHVQRIGAGIPKNISKEELKSLGMMGLFDALNKFDYRRELKFDTYASFRVRGAIIDGLRKEDWLPRSSREKAKKLETKIEELEQKLMRHASAEEIADFVEMPVEDVYNTVQEHFFSNVLSIDEQLQESEETESKSYVIRDDSLKTPEQQMVKRELIGDLADQIQQLNDNEQLVLSLFYTEELTLTVIGEMLCLSTSRISQIHSKALFKLRKLLMNEMMNV
ncbi:FliA/WhiG family RNA polymerase sigma factor [Psychrobacillus antarcticus]|uniref:FliA/WhiG family RNA polymerase sigma factor n=1 Tax=Psychrobacillus antarcticus TaxID=2879115 RepID=UPI0024084ADD|nr:FliA/WhiG family RNA polymerase sigma factor [Psychrobacillus antarcticus]